MKTINVILVTIFLTLLSMAASADPIVQTVPCEDKPALTCATGIDRLEIMDVTFNVKFVVGSYATVFANNDPYFLNDTARVVAATLAIENALNASGVVGAIGTGLGPRSFIYSPEDDGETSATGLIQADSIEYTGSVTGWFSFGRAWLPLDLDLADWQPDIFGSWAVFSLAVDIDIRPYSTKNRIWPRSWGFVPVAILGSQDFDALQVAIRTVRFGPNGAKAIRWLTRVRDVNRDGFPDLILRFKVRKTGIQCGDTEATLTGEDFYGQAFTSTDPIKTVLCH